MLKIIKQLKLALKPELIPADLASLLQTLNPENSYQERMDALGQLMDWIRLPVNSKGPEEIPHFVHSRDVRFRFLFNFLERNPTEAQFFAHTLQELITPGGSVTLYCLTGLTENHGFFNELTNRLVQRVLPESYSDRDLAEAFKVIFTEEEDAIWIESSFKNSFTLIRDFFVKHSISTDPLLKDLQDAKIILGAQLASLGTSSDIRRRLENKKLIDLNFLKLNGGINTILNDEDLLLLISDCREDLGKVRKNIESSGVSVDLIFKLEKMHAILDRIEMLIYLGKEYGPNAPLILGQFVGRLIRDELKNLGVKLYIRENLHLLTRKIVERSGDRGDHYIATTREEQRKLFFAATMAGILTAFTAMFKFLIGIQPFPLFFEGFFYFINYALSFLIMQKWHMALSSKQPAYTACVLSRSFEEFKKYKQFHEVGLEIRKIMKSQFLTTVANLAWVVPVCLLIDWSWFLITGDHMMTKSEAFFFLNKHHPLFSLTLPFAFLTGILLWFSSVAGGWVENWIVYREVNEAVRTSSFLKRLLTKPQVNYIADHFPGTVGGIAGNLSIAFLLTFPIILSKFTSFPVDIRHVTLSAGTVTFAFSALEWDPSLWPEMLITTVSILLIGLLNICVSFYFSIRMAAMARNLEPKFLKKIFRFAIKKNRPLPGP
ncbi:MAG: hypothetical protein ACLGHN_01385 [Bacteriovoracia bacterium]